MRCQTMRVLAVSCLNQPRQRPLCISTERKCSMTHLRLALRPCCLCGTRNQGNEGLSLQAGATVKEVLLVGCRMHQAARISTGCTP